MFVKISTKGNCLMDQEAIDIFDEMSLDQKNLMYKMVLADRVYMSSFSKAKINEVIFHDPATIVYWADGTKTVVKCMEGDTLNRETGIAMCVLKKTLGKSYTLFKKYLREIAEQENKETKKNERSLEVQTGHDKEETASSSDTDN